ncbi:MAG: response regulator [Sulfuritalea sp.]|nr:response regulator [Sulfuritalea sp.]
MATVMIIEDEVAIRDNLRRFLQIEGYAVVEAENGQQGLDKIRACLPDLILCDVMMPELDGFSLLKMLRADPHTAAVPFVFLTASAEKENLQLGQELGADEYVTKPFNLMDLAALIRRRLGEP